MGIPTDTFYEAEIRARLGHARHSIAGLLQRTNAMAATMQQVLDDLDEIKTGFDDYVAKRDKIDDGLRDEISKLVAANPALQAQVDSAFQKAEAQKALLTMTTTLPTSFVNKADFVKQVDLYKGPEQINLDGSLYVGGTTPALEFYTHSAASPDGLLPAGRIDNTPPTN